MSVQMQIQFVNMYTNYSWTLTLIFAFTLNSLKKNRYKIMTGGIMAETAKEFFDGLQEKIDPEKIKGINATYQWDIDDAGKWFATLTDEGATVGEGEAEDANITITVSEDNWLAIVGGTLAPQMAFLTGKIKIKGDMSLAMKLQNLMG